MDKNVSDEVFFTIVEGEKVYIGEERREDRRRTYRKDRVETLLKNFGLDRRLRNERRQQHSSWLLTSKRVINE
ncbi:MAG: hypothetical protein OEY19_00510 [Gammaproteobacteria bacterium]|nr:hypothetical protein [Gammaproteobacteria bacterium]MDH5630998.1 hypothetical protein [Gammaproteobacteria bacterium]